MKNLVMYFNLKFFRMNIKLILYSFFLLIIMDNSLLGACSDERNNIQSILGDCQTWSAANNTPVFTSIVKSGSWYIVKCHEYAVNMYSYAKSTGPYAPDCHPEYTPPIKEAVQIPNPEIKCGSIIQPANRVVGESIPLVGIPFDLIYFSNRVTGRKGDYLTNIKLNSSYVASTVSGYTLTIKDANANTLVSYNAPATANQVYAYEYNSSESDFNSIGPVKRITTIIENSSDYQMPIIPNTAYLGNLKIKNLGLGGWAPSNWYYYDVSSETLFKGNGNIRVVSGISDGSYIRVAEESGKEIYYFDTTGKISHIKTSLTGQIIYSFTYDSQGFLSSITQPFSKVTTFNRFSNGNLKEIVAPNGTVTAIQLDSNGYISQLTNANNEAYLMSYYGAGGLLHTFSPPNGSVATLTYDTLGNLVSDSNTNGFQANLAKTSSYINFTSALGRLTSTALNSGLNIETTITPSGLEIYNKNYSGYSEVESTPFYQYKEYTSDPRLGDQVRQFSRFYNANFGYRDNYFTYSTTLNNSADIFSINSLVKTQTIGPSINTSTYTGSNKKTNFATKNGRTAKLQIDQYERPIMSQVGNLNSRNYYYTNDLLTSVTEGARQTNLTYNTLGLLESMTDSLNQTTEFTYDAAQRLATTTLPDLRVIEYNYDYNGNLTSITPPLAQEHEITYGLNDKISSYNPPLLSGVSSVNTSYDYNIDKQLTKITRPDSQEINFNYSSSSGLMTSITGAFGTITKTYNDELPVIVTDQYNNSLNTTYTRSTPTSQSMKKGTVNIWSYTRTPATVGEKLASETIKGLGTSSINQTIAYGYDDDEYLTSAGAMTLSYNTPNGQLTGTTLGSITDSYTYNSFGEVQSYEAKYGSTTIYSYALTRDAIGRVATKTETLNGVTTAFGYTYDSAGRLVEVTTNNVLTSTYLYDDNSNRVGGLIRSEATSATYDQQDRLTDYNGTALTYNANGELLTKGSATYDYDVFGNLKAYSSGSTALTYEIDPLQRRLGRSVGGVLGERYMYNPEGKLVGTLDNTNKLVKTFVYGSKSHVPDYYIDSSNNKFRIISDYLGSVRLVVSSAGVVQQVMEHDEFGRVLQDTSAGLTPFGFAGGIYDSQSGVVRFGARDYDSQTGRWTTKDPIKFSGGDTNLYGYVFSDPINFIDANGLSADDVRKITGTFHNTVSNMTSSGKRTSPGFWNNMNKTAWDASSGKVGNNYQGCIDQASKMQTALSGQSYDDTWSFSSVGSDAPHLEPQSSLMFNLLPHWWLEGRSSNLNDPVLLIDPYNNIIKAK